MQINLIDDSSVNAAPTGFTPAIAAAAQFLDNLITNPITVNVLVGWGEYDNGTYSIGNNISLGGALAGIDLNYSQLRSDLIASASTAVDKFAVTSLPISDPTNGESFFVSDAEAKALGLLPANGSEMDGAVGFNANYSYNFNTNGQAVPGELDLVSDAELELAHALGMLLGTAMMLFRYSAPGVRELTVNGSVTPSAYFSIDKGNTNLNSYDTTSDSTLWNAATAGNDTFAIPYSYGEEHVFSLTDATELNVLGYNVNAPVSDILWRNATNGDVAIWNSNGSGGFTGNDLNALVPSSWQIQGVGDFNGDGKADILWRNATNGDVAIWNSNSGAETFAGQDLGIVPSSWNIFAGNDTLVASAANNTLYLNSGATTVVIGPGSGQDTILNFQTTQDTLQFSPSLFANYAAAMTSASQVGANTVFTIDANDSVTLQNVNMANLSAANFRFG